MAANLLNTAPPPMARSASVDAEFAGTLSASDLAVSGPTQIVRDGYIVIGSNARANTIVGLEEPRPVDLIADGFAEEPCNRYVVVGRRIRYSNVTAATCATTVSIRRPSFYPEIRIARSDFWWGGDQPSTMPAYEVLDRRLDPFYERIDKIAAGEWSPALGTRPNDRALSAARAVLDALNGRVVLPKRVVGGDEQIVFYFTNGPRYSNIEILNNGMMFVLHSDGQTAPKAERFKLKDDLSSILDAIRAHLA
jgi:hypothetical protein